VGLFVATHQTKLPGWNVSSKCPPIKQELVQVCQLLLLALPTAMDDVREQSMCNAAFRAS